MREVRDAELPVTVYTPVSALKDPAALARGMLSDLRAGRELAWRLTVRDISVQYRQTALGLLWVFLLPLATTGLWVLLARSGIVSVRETAVSYPVYVFSGVVLWQIFVESANAPLRVVVAARPMLAKIRFPREALVVSGIYQSLFNAAVKVGVLLPLVLLMDVRPGLTLLFVPVAIVSLVLAGTALGLLLTPIGLLYTDVSKSLPLVLQFLMYLTPVVFLVPPGGWGHALFRLNPLTPLVLTARDWLTGMPALHMGGFFAVTAASVGLLCVGWIVYRIAMPIMIERMSA